MVAGVLVLPALHPLLIPRVGVPSHLLWFAHVLPVAAYTFWYGRRASAASVSASGALVASGEAIFGAGYGSGADSATVWALTVAVVVSDLLSAGFALYARGVTRRHRSLVDRVLMAVLDLSPDGTVSSVNRAARNLLADVDDAGGLGRHIDELVRRPGGDSLLESPSSEPQEEVVEVAGRGWRTLHALTAVVPLDERGGMQVLVLDQSIQRAQERELERQARLAALGETLAGVAHELNNPLAVILAHAQAARLEGGQAPETAATLEAIESQAARMRDLVGDLLGYSRRRDADATVRLEEVVRRVAQIHRVAAGKRVSVDVEIAWEGTVPASGARIEQVLLNLLSNAQHAVSEAGGGRITVSVQRRLDHAVIDVRDTGAGIRESALEHLFDPFFTTKPEGVGTGLGLAISRHLVRGWGGEIEAMNREEGGACFRVTVPLAEESEGPASAA